MSFDPFLELERIRRGGEADHGTEAAPERYGPANPAKAANPAQAIVHFSRFSRFSQAEPSETEPCPTCGDRPGVLLCRGRCGRGVEAADAFLATVPPEVRQEPPEAAGEPVYERPEWEHRCQRCKELFLVGVTVLACGTCDARREPASRRGGPGNAA